MSLLACPQVEFLDEPTTGVDPVSRRSLFKMLKHLPKCSLILTTHRMDEAESLCDNIAIMINGRFVVYGSPGHLKSKYGTGYLINLNFPANQLDTVNKMTTESMSYLEFKSTHFLGDETVDGEKVQQVSYMVKEDVDLSQVGGLGTIFKQLCSLKYD